MSRDQSVLHDFLFMLADDELIYGHRASEWLGLAPDLEEDIAFSSISQDEVGHALYYYELLHQNGENEVDALVFDRPSHNWRNSTLLERQNGDWAYTVARGYFYESFDQIRLEGLKMSSLRPLQEGAVKMLREERYHTLHMQTWIERLARARGEGHLRIKNALESVWSDCGDLFTLGNRESELLDTGIFPWSANELFDRFEYKVKRELNDWGLDYLGKPRTFFANGRLGLHSEELSDLLDTMTEVYRLDRAARW